MLLDCYINQSIPTLSEIGSIILILFHSSYNCKDRASNECEHSTADTNCSSSVNSEIESKRMSNSTN